MAWCDERGDRTVGRWWELKRWVREAGGFYVGRDCLEQTTGGTHSTTSAHYPWNGARAVDFGDIGVDHVAIARWLVQYARGPGHTIAELFCTDAAIAWQNGEVSSFVDNPNHTHAALRPGAQLPWPVKVRRRDDDDTMATPTGGPILGKFAFPLVPTDGGASGAVDGMPAYNRTTWAALVVAVPLSVHFSVVYERDGHKYERASGDVQLAPGKTNVYVAEPDASQPSRGFPNAIVVTPADNAVPWGWQTEWSRPVAPAAALAATAEAEPQDQPVA